MRGGYISGASQCVSKYTSNFAGGEGWEDEDGEGMRKCYQW